MACYRLMNKDYPVLEFEYDLESHVATRIVEVIDAAHAPLGLFDECGNTSRRDLNYWWRHRAIPASREQVERLLENLKLDSTLELAERNFGLLLSDRYWIDDVDAPQRWEDINFFDNDFSDDLGILTLGQDSSASMERLDYAHVNLTSPSSTVGGDLRKKWKIIDGARVLVKSGVGAFNQEPYNEVVATELHRRLLEPDVPQLELPVDFKYTAKPFKYNGMRPYSQLRLFEGHLGWVREEALADFCDCMGDVLGQNPNISPARMDAIVRRVSELASDVVFVARH